jgi:hypothetical protein
MSIRSTGSVILLSLALGLGAAACAKEPGPAEKAGVKLDAAAGDVKAAVKEAADKVEKAAEEAKEDLEH